MNRIIFPLVVLAFVQLVNGQVSTRACTDAVTALSENTGCTTAIATGTNISTLCTGTCGDLLYDIINNCDSTVSIATCIYVGYMQLLYS